jgi:hypothetical protein
MVEGVKIKKLLKHCDEHVLMQSFGTILIENAFH